MNNEGTFSLECENCKWSSQTELGITGTDAQSLFAKVNERETTTAANKDIQALVKSYGERYREAREVKLKEAEEKPSGAKERGPSDHDMKKAVAKLDATLEEKRNGLWRLPQEAVENKSAQAHVDTGYVHDQVSSLPQRLAHPADFCKPQSELWPRGQILRTKLGHRCGKCKQHVLKPKAGATKVTFDISHLASNTVPSITVPADLPAFAKGKTETLVLYFKNPLDAEVTMTLSTAPEAPKGQRRQSMMDEGIVLEDEGEEGGIVLEDEGGDEGMAKIVQLQDTAKVELPASPIKLTAYDEIAEQNELLASSDEKTSAEDDKAVVASRHLSKVGVFVKVTPSEAGDVKFSFIVTLEAKSSSGIDEDEEDLLAFRTLSYQVSFNLGPAS